MKKLLLTLIFMAVIGFAGYCHAYSFGDLYSDVASQSKFTILKTAVPVYMYDFRDTQSRHRGGFFTPVYEIVFFEAGFGWRTPYDSGKLGTVVGGGGIRIDKAFNVIAEGLGGDPQAWVEAVIPRSARSFWNRLRLGYSVGHDFDTKRIAEVFYSGIAFQF